MISIFLKKVRYSSEKNCAQIYERDDRRFESRFGIYLKTFEIL